MTHPVEASSLVERLQVEVQSLTTKLGMAEYAMGTVAKFVRPRIPADQNPEQATSFLAWIGMILRLEERAEHAEARLASSATLIEQLERQLATAREALEPFARAAEAYDPDENDGHEEAWDFRATMGELRCARTALQPHEGQG